MMVQDTASYEETMALLNILALGLRQIEEGRVQPAAGVIGKLRNRKSEP